MCCIFYVVWLFDCIVCFCVELMRFLIGCWYVSWMNVFWRKLWVCCMVGVCGCVC